LLFSVLHLTKKKGKSDLKVIFILNEAENLFTQKKNASETREHSFVEKLKEP